MITDKFIIHDVGGWKLNINPTTGRYPKLELSNGEKHYIVKFAAHSPQISREVPYHVSEYIACKIISSLGYDTQNVNLVTFRGRPGCLMEVFEEALITFPGLGTSTLSGENLNYDLDALHGLLNEGKFAFTFSDYLWDTFILDAFITNLDRHPNNWGFFKREGLYHRAPLFDNASSLYSVNAFALGGMADLELHIKKFSKSMVSYQGERQSFETILLSEKSEAYKERLLEFKRRLSSLDLSSLGRVAKAWPTYKPYVDFVRKFLERQVKWFEAQV